MARQSLRVFAIFPASQVFMNHNAWTHTASTCPARPDRFIVPNAGAADVNGPITEWS
jgi:hypothetical protein